MQQCRALEFGQPPDYRQLKALFRSVMDRHQHIYDYHYEWT